MVYRRVVDIPDQEKADQIFSKLPASALTAPATYYKHRNFKNAPSWQDGVKLIPLVLMLVSITDGHNVHQLSFAKQMFNWAEAEGASVTRLQADQLVYGVRALVAQLLHHKAKGRSIPSAFAHRYGPIFQKLNVEAASSSTRDGGACEGAGGADGPGDGGRGCGDGDDSSDVEVIEPPPAMERTCGDVLDTDEEGAMIAGM
eukprot:5881712-Pyramimonas_sp.AAC.1